MRSSLSRTTAARLRIETTLRDFLPIVGPPRKIAFIHTPKCGGTTVMNYISRCVGGKESGRTGKLTELWLGQSPSNEEIERARAGRFIAGHYSWDSIERLNLSDDTYIFTFLREPKSRLGSWYRIASEFPDDLVHEAARELAEKCRGLSRVELFSSRELAIRNMTDNCMVRQLAGRLVTYPVADDEWPDLLETAKSNLRKLDFIGLHETYDDDFIVLMQQLGLPHPHTVPRDNVTSNWVSGHEAVECEDEVAAAMAPLVHWDQQLYGYARALRTSR